MNHLNHNAENIKDSLFSYEKISGDILDNSLCHLHSMEMREDIYFNSNILNLIASDNILFNNVDIGLENYERMFCDRNN